MGDLDGKVIEGNHKPSSDTTSHLYVYHHRPEVNGIVHTHSTFATAWAAVGRPIPPALTAICDEFGGPIPVGSYARIGGDEIGKEISAEEVRRAHRRYLEEYGQSR